MSERTQFVGARIDAKADATVGCFHRGFEGLAPNEPKIWVRSGVGQTITRALKPALWRF